MNSLYGAISGVLDAGIVGRLIRKDRVFDGV